MEVKILKETKGRYVKATIKLEEGRLSVTGHEGRILHRNKAKVEARRFWESFFEDQPEEIFSMNKKQGTRFTSAKGAARYVLQHDGDLHGVDVDWEDGDRVYILDSCGCIHETLIKAFPELAELIPYHLNDMHAGCDHQEALGWGHGHDVALSKDELTEAQRASLTAGAHRKGEAKRAAEIKSLTSRAVSDKIYRHELLTKVLGHGPSVEDFEALIVSFPSAYQKTVQAKVKAHLEKLIGELNPDAQIESQVFKDSLEAPCPTCGYRYGTEWKRRELPAAVVAKVRALKAA
jgi:hypothetical protein